MKEFFREIWRSVSDIKFYRKIKDNSIGKSLKYMFLLLFVMSLILSIYFGYGLGKGIDIAIDWIKNNVPVINIQKGLASVEVEQPYKVEQDGFTFIIDTTGNTTSLDEYKRGALLLKDKLIYKDNEAKTEIYSLANIQALRVDENFLKVIKRNAAWIIFPFILIGVYIYFMIARFIQILLFSLITMFTAAIAKVELNYGQIFNLGIYAITPSMIFGFFLAFFLRPVPFVWSAYAILYAVYLITAVTSLKEKS